MFLIQHVHFAGFSVNLCCYSCVILFLGPDEKETMPYFAAHFEQQLELYKTQVGLLCLGLFLSMLRIVLVVTTCKNQLF